ncbi:hypothetical protein P3T16_006666 [Paraburkholderia sp. GAS42]
MRLLPGFFAKAKPERAAPDERPACARRAANAGRTLYATPRRGQPRGRMRQPPHAAPDATVNDSLIRVANDFFDLLLHFGGDLADNFLCLHVLGNLFDA